MSDTNNYLYQVLEFLCSYETLSILMCKVLVSKACTTIKREVCQPRRRKKTQNLVENRT